jgi:hypothetical protein
VTGLGGCPSLPRLLSSRHHHNDNSSSPDLLNLTQNNYGITLADVIDLKSNSRDKGAYEAYKAVIEIIAVCT